MGEYLLRMGEIMSLIPSTTKYVCVRERQRERKTQRQRHRETEKQREVRALPS